MVLAAQHNVHLHGIFFSTATIGEVYRPVQPQNKPCRLAWDLREVNRYIEPVATVCQGPMDLVRGALGRFLFALIR